MSLASSLTNQFTRRPRPISNQHKIGFCDVKSFAICDSNGLFVNNGIASHIKLAFYHVGIPIAWRKLFYTFLHALLWCLYLHANVRPTLPKYTDTLQPCLN